MLETKVSAFIKKKDLLHTNDSVLVGVSGGPDSLALLDFLLQWKDAYQLRLVVAHVDHMFRGKESYEDYLYVQQFCDERGVVFEGIRVDVPKYIEETGLNSQQAARDCRYAFYKDIMEKHSIHKLALAHHLDDQAESVLMNIVRGNGGLARTGIPLSRPFANGHIIRPFLSVSRQEIINYCKRHHLVPRIDPSNDKDIYTRNRFRKQIIPQLKCENAKALEHIQRFSEELEEDEKFLHSLAERTFEALEKNEKDGIFSFSVQSFQEMPKPLQRRVIQLILNYLYQVKPFVFSYVHIESIMSLFDDNKPSISVQLPHRLQATKAYDQLLFHFGDLPTSTICQQISIPGQTILPNGSIIETIPAADDCTEKTDAYTCLLALTREQLPLKVRNKRDGDRYQPVGFTKGHKKLKKLFQENKIPLHERENWPILVDQQDRIVWVPGLQKVQNTRDPHAALFLMKYIESSSSRRTTE